MVGCLFGYTWGGLFGSVVTIIGLWVVSTPVITTGWLMTTLSPFVTLIVMGALAANPLIRIVMVISTRCSMSVNVGRRVGC